MTLKQGQASWFASWCYKPSQPQRIISGLKTNFNLSASYSSHKSLYHKSFSQTTTPIIPTISERKPRKKHNTWFGACLYSAVTQHGNLHQLCVMMGRVTFFSLRSHTGTGVSHSLQGKTPGEVLEKMLVHGSEG